MQSTYILFLKYSIYINLVLDLTEIVSLSEQNQPPGRTEVPLHSQFQNTIFLIHFSPNPLFLLLLSNYNPTTYINSHTYHPTQFFDMRMQHITSLQMPKTEKIIRERLKAITDDIHRFICSYPLLFAAADYTVCLLPFV